MQNVMRVETVDVYRFLSTDGSRVLVSATGKVGTSGWSEIRLSPRFYADPPEDGIWEFDLGGDPPPNMALEVDVTVSASTIAAAPNWLKGVKIHADGTYQESNEILDRQQSNKLDGNIKNFVNTNRVLLQQQLATYDDSFQPIGFCGGLSVKMKKLRHELTLTIEGPDEDKMRRCVQEAVGAGLVAAIIAVYATGGGALSAATSIFLRHVKDCLKDGFDARIDDKSHWIEWCT